MARYTPPDQLELEFINESGKSTDKHSPCDAITLGVDLLRTIVGLDASLCKCHQCLSRAADGIWWVDAWTRKHGKKMGAITWTGDVARDTEE